MKRGASELYVLEADQVRALLQEAQGVEDRLILQLMLYVGLRVSEVAHLNNSWVKGDEIRIPLSQTCDCINCKSGEWKAKSKASNRVIPVPVSIMRDLTEYLRQSPRGFTLTRQALWWKIKQMSKRANIRVRGLSSDTIYPHVLRATCATILASKGMSVAALCYVMGWQSIEVGQHYISIAKAKQDAQEQFRKIMH